MGSAMFPRSADRLSHLGRLALAVDLFLLVARLAGPPGALLAGAGLWLAALPHPPALNHGALGLAGRPGALVAGAALWLAAFDAAHDLIHDALGLGRRAGAVALTVVGALLLGSGHAMLVSHLLHHKRPFAADDYEGAAARGAAGPA